MNINVQQLPHLADLFKLFNSGKHLNRLSEPQLWAELEQFQEAYVALFKALGFELCVDGRGFAWFHNEDVSPSVTGQSRQLALLFMVIFDTQADMGQPLQRFSDWRVDRKLIEAAMEKHLELLNAEGMSVELLEGLLSKAETFGFARLQTDHCQLLPAVCRYLDHFEALAAHAREQEQGLEADFNEDELSNDMDEMESAPDATGEVQ